MMSLSFPFYMDLVNITFNLLKDTVTVISELEICCRLSRLSRMSRLAVELDSPAILGVSVVDIGCLVIPHCLASYVCAIVLII